MDNYSITNPQPTNSDLPQIKKKNSFFSQKKIPLILTGGLIVLLIMGAVGVSLTQFNRTTDTRSQASAAKKANLTIESSTVDNKMIYTVYYDGTQLPAGTRVVSFNSTIRLHPNSTVSQTQVLGDSIEIEDEELAQQIAATDPTTNCGGTKCPVGYGCVIVGNMKPFCAPFTSAIHASPQPSNRPTAAPSVKPSPKPSSSIKPSPYPSPKAGTRILGSYQTLQVVGLTSAFNLNTPKFKTEVTSTGTETGDLELMINPEDVLVEMSGTTTSHGSSPDNASQQMLTKKIPLFRIEHDLSNSGIQYTNVDFTIKSVKGYLPGIQTLVELTSKGITASPMPTVKPKISPIPTPGVVSSPVIVPTTVPTPLPTPTVFATPAASPMSANSCVKDRQVYNTCQTKDGQIGVFLVEGHCLNGSYFSNIAKNQDRLVPTSGCQTKAQLYALLEKYCADKCR